MKKILLTVVCLCIALPAVPSFAIDSDVSGFLRARFMMNNYQKSQTDRDPDTLVDQRARVKWSAKVDEYLTFVYYGEVDFIYGDQAYATSRNKGGGASADSVNLETKNLYVEAKIPETPVTATIGLQGYTDHNDFVLLLGDVAGVRIGAATDQVRGNIAWFKLSEGVHNNEDDATLWALQVVYDPMKELSLVGDLYYANMQGSTPSGAAFDTTKEDLYFATVRATYKMDMATIEGWLLYTGGTIDDAAPDGSDVDVSGFAGAANANFSVAGAKATIYTMFFSSDDDDTNKDKDSIEIPWATNAPVGMSVPFPKAGMMMMMADPFGTTIHTGYGHAMADAAYNDYGLWAITAKVAYSPPEMKNLYGSLAAGYFTALEDQIQGRDSVKKGGKDLGVETVARVGYKFGKLDLSLNAGYVFLGSFYDKTAVDSNGAVKDPDDLYEVYAMANVNF